jgi:RNA recognition motif-containing protein
MAPFAYSKLAAFMEEWMKRLYIGNLASVVTSDALQKLFGDRGFQVASVRIICDREGGRSRGFGFVEFASSEDADRATDALDGFEIEGRPLRIHEARARDASDRHNYVTARVSAVPSAK